MCDVFFTYNKILTKDLWRIGYKIANLKI